ncbi:hypothetical protein [Aeromonas salmonicida]|uniref:hypothetical protein n=1 Tax=Aeromonas salmonicida TaxID=645 RepID=UPI00232FBC90|nr:hypothetical protein [Aeromonas salmonicida]WCH28243.1 hypothetical protein ONZ66_05355 [Aeromonas salmonicida]
MKKRIQVLVYSLWGLITLIFGLTSYKEIYEPGMGFWSSTLTVISATLMTLVALLALSWAILSIDRIRNKLLPKPKYRLVNNYSMPCILILMITISNTVGSSASAMQGKKLGFLSEVEFSDAKINKIFDKDEYSKYLVEKREKDKSDEEKIAANKAKQEETAAIENAVDLFSTADRDIIRTLIGNDIKENSELTKIILQEIRENQTDSVERTISETDYIDYGVRSKEFEPELKSTSCYMVFKERSQRAKSIYAHETQNWQSLSNFKRDVGDGSILQAEIDYRERFNKSNLETLKKLNDELSICSYKTAQSMKNHLTREFNTQ